MAENSFDVVVDTERQEVDNAVNQAAKEVAQRYDLKGTAARVAWSGEQVVVTANSEERVQAALDVFTPGGGTYRHHRLGLLAVSR